MSHEKKPVVEMPEVPVPMSRRQMLRGTAIAAGGVTLAAATLRAPVARAQAKVSQTQAGYQDKPNGDQRCDNCTLFQAPSSCKVVDGTISASAWCKLYQKKS